MPVDVATARARYGDFVAEQLAAAGQREWRVSRLGAWTYATPEVPPRDQGWKLHVSATLASADEVLRRAVPVLIDAGAPFKVASTAADLASLNSNHCPRPSSGKFITVYPRDDDQAVALMASLDRATAGLPGPVILSDRPYRPGGLVHYRYGAFRGRTYISNDGDVVHAIIGPDGELVEDRRTAHFAPPEWARPPIAEPPVKPEPKRPEVLLDDRFVVRQALRYANKGGVFQAIDKRTGEEVVVKQARAHVGGDERGLDVRQLLANEAHVLDLLQGTGVTPRLVAFFQQGGDSFLAEEAVAGETLRAWNAARWEDEVPPAGETLAVARKVAAALAVVHQQGVIVRDFTPNNLIVQPEGNLRLVDLELAVPTDGVDDYQPHLDPGHRSLTPAYGSPGQAAGLSPALSDDSFALGAILCFLFTGEDPYVDPDSPMAQTACPLATWLGSGHRARLVPPGIRALALALTDPGPSQRLSAAGASIILRRLEERGLKAERPSRRQLEEATITDLRALADVDGDRVVKDALAAIRSSARPENERFWPVTAFGATTDPRNVQHGVAGVIGALVQSWRCSGDQDILELVRHAATWLVARASSLPFAPVGVHFGAAGQAWSLFDAGRALEDDRLMEQAVELALRLPPDWPGPDITHGRAGLGLTLLHLYKLTGDSRLLTAAGRCAGSLLRDVEPISTGRVGWRTPPGFRSSFAGRTFYGFAHGTAGIATFLLAMATTSGREDCRAMASAAASSLVESCTRRDGLVGWGEGPDKPASLLPYWCNGASGIGSFLLRWWRVSQDDSLVPVVEGAARTVMASKWRSGVAYCHGLAGNGDFLLDAGDFLGDSRYYLWAADLASVLFDRRAVQDGLCTFGDQPGARTPDFNVGLAGVLSFFLRLRHGGPRLWMVDSDVAAQ
jgi:tRNA A-37 threonylcarbamoyl transferase component Bud32